jgi:hypothetical protein
MEDVKLMWRLIQNETVHSAFGPLLAAVGDWESEDRAIGMS